MFLRFRFANHRSIREEVELSFVASKDSPNGRSIEGIDGLRVLPAAALYGANASGKSAILDAVSFLSSAVRFSHRGWDAEGGTPRQPFALDRSSVNETSLFEADVLVDGVRMTYGFELDDAAVTAEWIHAWPNGRRQVWLDREGQNFRFGKHLPGENRAHEAMTRPNSLFLSVAAQNNHQQLRSLYRAFTVGIATPRTPKHESLDVALDRTAAALGDWRRPQVVALVRLADLGIEDVIDLAGPSLASMSLFNPHEMARLESDEAQTWETWQPPSRATGTVRRRRGSVSSDLRFVHRGSPGGSLTVGQESAGTLSWFALVGELVDVMNYGGLLCFDELDATLHPALASEVVHLFQNAETNPHNAQLLAACHDTTVLSPATEGRLHRDQVWLTEKNDEGATSLMPLSDFHVRADQNLEYGYRQGRFGAVPFVAAQSFADALTPEGSAA